MGKIPAETGSQTDSHIKFIGKRLPFHVKFQSGLKPRPKTPPFVGNGSIAPQHNTARCKRKIKGSAQYQVFINIPFYSNPIYLWVMGDIKSFFISSQSQNKVSAVLIISKPCDKGKASLKPAVSVHKKRLAA